MRLCSNIMLLVVTLTFINSQIIIFFLFMVFLSFLFIFLLWNSILIIIMYTVKCGDRGGTVVKVCYKSEGHWFDSK